MATSSSVMRAIRLVAISAAGCLAVALAPGSVSAEPTSPATSAEAQADLVDLNRRLEVLTEQYNVSGVLVQEHREAAARSQVRLAEVNASIAGLQERVGSVARTAYTSDRLAGFTVLMTSGSPQEFLDKLNTLDAISGYNNGAVRALTEAQAEATTLVRESDAALAQAETAAADIDAARAQIEAQIPVLEALLASLTEDERQAAFAADTDERPADRADRGSADRGPSAPIPAPTQAAQVAVDTAYAQLGEPYVWGAAGPDAFDCSGLTMYAYAAAGISLPHSSQMQFNSGVPVSRDQLLPGDLVFFYSPISHVAIYIGDGNMITAPQSGDVVKIQSISAMPYSGARRIATG